MSLAAVLDTQSITGADPHRNDNASAVAHRYGTAVAHSELEIWLNSNANTAELEHTKFAFLYHSFI
jgi:hypothetical protein